MDIFYFKFEIGHDWVMINAPRKKRKEASLHFACSHYLVDTTPHVFFLITVFSTFCFKGREIESEGGTLSNLASFPCCAISEGTSIYTFIVISNSSLQ